MNLEKRNNRVVRITEIEEDVTLEQLETRKAFLQEQIVEVNQEIAQHKSLIPPEVTE